MIDQALETTASGLLFDLAGVILLGFAFFFKTLESIKQESQVNYYGCNPHIVRNIIASKLDGMTGTLLLAIGFVLQFLGVLKISNSCFVVGSYIFLLLFLVSYFAGIRQKAINTLVNKLNAGDSSG